MCISSGRLVWLLEIDLKLLAFNGNLIDNVFAATILTLSSYKMPVVRIAGFEENEKILIYPSF